MFANKQIMKLISDIISTKSTYSVIPSNILPMHSLKPVLKERLRDHFIQQWFTDVENSSRGEFYSIFK
jgi:hypothetical protein